MSKILVTGAAGFIGSQLAYRLWHEGNELVLLDNFSYGNEGNLVFADKDFRKDIMRVDVRDQKKVDEIYKNAHLDYVYHIAGITPLPDCQINPAQAEAVNVIGTINILEAGRKYGVQKVIFASTSAVYENNVDFPSTEDNTISPSLIYPNTKYTAERYCRAYTDVYNMSTVCLRFANVYGPHIDCLRKQPPVMGYLIREYFWNRAPVLHSDGNQCRDFIYIDDLVDLALRVQKGIGFDIVNVSTNTVATLREIAETIARVMGKENILPIYVPAENYWNTYSELYEGIYPISECIVDHEVNKYTQLSNTHAREKYGWTPRTDIVSGIKKTVDYCIQILKM